MLFCSSAGNQESLGLDEGEFHGASSRSSMANIIKSCQAKTLCLTLAEVSACTLLLLSPCLQLGGGSTSSLAVLQERGGRAAGQQSLQRGGTGAWRQAHVLDLLL